MEPFATAFYFKENGFAVPAGLDDDQLDLALARASRNLRGEVAGVDARINAGTLDPNLVADIVCEMVVSAFQQAGPAGVESIQAGAGPFQKTYRFPHPTGDMFLTAKHKRLLAVAQPRRAFTIRVRGG